MQSPIKILETHTNFAGIFLPHHISRRNIPRTIFCTSLNPNHNPNPRREKLIVNAKGKDNVWSVDNEMAKAGEKSKRRGGRRKKGKIGKRVKNFGDGENFIVSGSMLVEVENVLQTQEPVIRPAWNTFVSSVSGIWKGVGAVFSPTTAEMEPVEAGSNNEYLYDCYILAHVQAADLGGKTSHIKRKINWVTLNPHGENRVENGDNNSENGEGKREHITSVVKGKGHKTNRVMPKFESFNFEKSDVMEEDIMGMEPGLVFFEVFSFDECFIHVGYEPCGFICFKAFKWRCIFVAEFT